MKIEAVDFFYLAMSEVLNIGDGSQDALLVRICLGDSVGWGECEASPLVSIAGLVAPMSHSACLGVQDSLLGQRLESADDIHRIGQRVRERSRDLLQCDHILSGVDIAMWDLLGRRRNEPIYRLLGYPRSFSKLPYASLLFGDEPEDTRRRAAEVVRAGLRAAKFGWGA